MPEQDTQSQEPREYSVIELDQAVEAGQISQLQKEQILQQQIERKIARTVDTRVAEVVEHTTRENNLDNQLRTYADAAPELLKDGSPLRQRVASEFEFLVANGAPRTLTTELAAVRAVMGPPERVRQHVQGRRVGADAFADSSGSQELSPRERRAQDAFAKLSPDKQQHYERLISRGLYANKAAVLSELTWTRKDPQREARQ